ncbi:MAG: hypothetical protein E7C50_16765 [Clostridium sp.]|uniref:hypothetical protein n=1 Tax=Clostridium sp. TaxID=1506 RepID=UPI0028FF8119|nr:hypothetical protein [Clostridium sp.]MDU2683515.1 hypothetical protein [Clostridium sp.]
MEFITVEQFKEQPVEVQKVFLDWWKCEVFDIYAWAWNIDENNWCIESCYNQIQADTINKFKKGITTTIPLFTEGQLRKFIEDKTGGKVDASFNGETYTVYSNEDFGLIIKMYEDIDDDLLQAYWKVACMVAKEGLNG